MKKHYFAIIFLILLCAGCSPQKRLDRLINRYPELLIADTIRTNILVEIPAKEADFSINYTIKDSLITIYTTDSIRLQYLIVNDSIINLNFSVPPQKLYYPVNVPVERIKQIKPDNWGLLIEKIPYIAVAFLTIFIIILIYGQKK